MDNNKGINGSGLAHLWGKASSEFAKKKIVTEPVYPLSNETNYTGVFADKGWGEGFDKVADNLYSPDELIGKKIIHGAFDTGRIIQSEDIKTLSENGSFANKGSLWAVITPQDVGKVLFVGDPISFPEAGTYFLGGHTEDIIKIFIAGTYKREVEAHDFDVIVEGALNPLNLSVDSLNKNYAEIAEALNLKKDVRLLLSVPMGADNVMTVLGTVETFRPNEGFIEFGVMLDTTLNKDDGEQVYHFRITLWEDESVSTEYKVLSGGGSGSEAVSPTVEVTQIDNGHRVTVTYGNDSESFDVMNGKDGKPFTFADFTAEQLEALKGKAFTYEDFTEEQLNALKGKAFTYDDFTPEQLEALKVKGDKGDNYVLTDADKSNIADIVLSKLSTWNGGSY